MDCDFDDLQFFSVSCINEEGCLLPTKLRQNFALNAPVDIRAKVLDSYDVIIALQPNGDQLTHTE